MEGGQQPGTYTYVGSGALKVCVFPQIRQPVVLGHEANAALCLSNCRFPSFSYALSPGVVRGGVGWGGLFCVSAVSLCRAPGVVEASGTECGVRVCALLVLRGAAGEILPMADTLWMCSCGLLSYPHLGGGLITLSVRL